MDRLAQTLQPTGDTLTELHPASSMWTCLARDIGDPGTRELRPLRHLGLGNIKPFLERPRHGDPATRELLPHAT